MIQSLLRALELLEALKDPERSFSVAELSEAVALPPSSVHRMLQTLCAKDFVIKDERTHLYQLGPALISLGMAASHQIKLQSVCQPVLRRLSDITGEDAFLMIRIGMKGLILEKAEGPNILKVVDHFGYEQELHCGAIRKVLLAYQDEEFWKTYIAHGLSRRAENTVTDPEALIGDLKSIRRDGVAISRSEYIEDAVGIGAPVFSADGGIAASIGIITPSSRAEGEHLTKLRNDVADCGKKLSYRLGYALPLL